MLYVCGDSSLTAEEAEAMQQTIMQSLLCSIHITLLQRLSCTLFQKQDRIREKHSDYTANLEANGAFISFSF